jgi:hypothetical protein
VTDLAGRGWRAGAADVWSVAEPLAQALVAVHRAGVVHRDLNPANVLVTTRGGPAPGAPTAVAGWDERLVLADLGLCKDLALNSGHTSAGGTEGFRPPELRRGPAVIDGRADLWSLSALIVWLVTGAPPGDVPAEVALAGTGLPVALARVLDRSLAVDPADRHADPHAWLADVSAALGVPPGAVPVTLLPPPPPPPPPADAIGPFLAAADAHGLFPASSPQGTVGALPYPVAATGPLPFGGTPVTGLWHPDGTPVDAGRPGSARGSGWRLRHSAWVLTALPLGLTTWIGFLIIGVQADRQGWRRAAAAYGVAAATILVLAMASPTGPDGETETGAWQSVVGATVLAVTWLGGCAHALIANAAWLRWRSCQP